ncbi:TPA: hypothetical protein MO359_002372 [Salmonella enterica subsp. diarizonae serovar 61:i:z]|nr:hypothetical protein [Salmonella enterica subsp. diarizonae serovar 61:i:z]
MIRNIIKSLFRKRTRYPRTGWFYMTSSGHIVRVLLVDQETQKVVCAPLGAGYQLADNTRNCSGLRSGAAGL